MEEDNEVKHYAYFFTRQDISPEQQLVQTAHAAYQLGQCVFGGKDSHPDANETYFTVIGVRNMDALNAVRNILDKFNYKYTMFYEPDISDFTSIAVYPVPEDKRHVLMAFDLLKFSSKG